MTTAPTGTANHSVHCAGLGLQRVHAVPAKPGDIRGEPVTAQPNRPARPEASRLARFRILLKNPRLVVRVVIPDSPGADDLVESTALRFYGERVEVISRA